MGAHPIQASVVGRVWCVLVCLWLTIAAGPAQAAAPTLNIDPDSEKQSLDGHVEVLLDRSGQLELADVQASTAWAEVGSQPYAKGLERGVVWLRFRMHNPAEVPVDRLMKISSGHVDEITMWMGDGEGNVYG